MIKTKIIKKKIILEFSRKSENYLILIRDQTGSVERYISKRLNLFRLTSVFNFYVMFENKINIRKHPY